MSSDTLNTKELRRLQRLVVLWRVHGMKHSKVVEILGKRYGWSPADCEELFIWMESPEGRGGA